MASRDQETQPSSSALSREEIREAAKAARACKVLAPGSLRLLHSDIDDDISDRLPEPFRPEYAIALASLKAHHYAEAQSVLWDLQVRENAGNAASPFEDFDGHPAKAYLQPLSSSYSFKHALQSDLGTC